MGASFMRFEKSLTKSLTGRCTQKQVMMKVRNSLKSLRNRHRANQLVRRRGRLFVINKINRRFKARQG